MAETSATIKIASRYEALAVDREPYLRRAREAAELTIPALYPPEGHTPQSRLYNPYQSLGASGVDNLAAKLTLSQLPPNSTFFRHDADEFALEEAEAQQKGTTQDAIKKLAKYDRTVMRRIEAAGDRPVVTEAMKHLIVAGNVALDVSEEKAREVSLARYVVVRSPRGEVMEFIHHEPLTVGTVPDGAYEVLPDILKTQGELDPSTPVDLYTRYVFKRGSRSKGMYEVTQEVGGEIIEASSGTIPFDEFPYLVLRFTVVSEENYGRSYMDGLMGDLSSLEVLTQAIVDAGSMASRVIFLVRRNGTTRAIDLQKAKNGGFVPGNSDDVTTLRLDKGADLRVAMETAVRLEDRLERQYLLKSSVTRDAERVTAAEIRELAGELDDSLAGIYSILAQEFQRPYIRLKISTMTDLPKLPEEAVNVTITTGLEALGRTQDLRKLDAFMEGLERFYGPEKIARTIPLNSYATRRAAALGLDTDGLILDEEEVARNVQQEQLQAAAQQVAPGVATELVKGQMNAQQTQG